MTPAEHCIRGLYAGWRILLFDREAAGFLEAGGLGVLRSFLALLIAGPLYLLLMYFVGLDPHAPDVARAPVWLLLIAYAAGWPIFSFLMFHLSKFLEIGPRFSAFMVLFNWWRVFALLLALPANILIAYGVLSDGSADGLLAGTAGLIFVYKLFLVRTSFAVNIFQAVLIVSLDIILFLILEDSVLNAFSPPA